MAISWDIIKTQLHKKYIVLSTLCLQICQLSRAPALFIAVIKFPFLYNGKVFGDFFIYLAKLAFFSACSLPAPLDPRERCRCFLVFFSFLLPSGFTLRAAPFFIYSVNSVNSIFVYRPVNSEFINNHLYSFRELPQNFFQCVSSAACQSPVKRKKPLH